MPCSWMGRLSMVNMATSPKLLNSFNAILIKMPERFLVDADKIILKPILTSKGTRILKTNLKKRK